MQLENLQGRTFLMACDILWLKACLRACSCIRCTLALALNEKPTLEEQLNRKNKAASHNTKTWTPTTYQHPNKQTHQQEQHKRHDQTKKPTRTHTHTSGHGAIYVNLGRLFQSQSTNKQVGSFSMFLGSLAICIYVKCLPGDKDIICCLGPL